MAGGHAPARHRGLRPRPDRPVAGGHLRAGPRGRAAGSPPSCTGGSANRTTATPARSRGVIGFVDMGRAEVLEVIDTGVVPVPPEAGSYYPEDHEPLRTDLKALEISQPEGPSFVVEGNQIRWQKWSLRICDGPARGSRRPHRRPTTTAGRTRPVLHRGSITEMVVPYGDTRPDARLEERVRRRRVGARAHGQLAHARLRLRRRDPLLRLRVRRRAGQPPHARQCGLPPRGGLRDPLEARRPADGPHRGAPVAPARGQHHRHRRQLRVRLLLVLLSRRHHPARGEADRDHVHHGGSSRASAAAPRERRRPRARGAVPPAPVQRPPRRRVDGPDNTVYEVDAVADPAGPDNPWGNAFDAEATRPRAREAAIADVDPARQPALADREPLGRRTASGTPVALQARRRRRPRRCWPTPTRASGRRAASPPTTSGSPRSTRPSAGPRATIPTSTGASTGCPAGPTPDRPIVDTDVVRLAHLRRHAHPATRGLAGHAGRVHGVLIGAGGILRRQPRPRRPTARATVTATTAERRPTGRIGADGGGLPPAGRGVPRDGARADRGGDPGHPGAHRRAPRPLGALGVRDARPPRGRRLPRRDRGAWSSSPRAGPRWPRRWCASTGWPSGSSSTSSGCEWHKVHQEAGRWEHVISDDVEARLVESAGGPRDLSARQSDPRARTHRRRVRSNARCQRRRPATRSASSASARRSSST